MTTASVAVVGVHVLGNPTPPAAKGEMVQIAVSGPVITVPDASAAFLMLTVAGDFVPGSTNDCWVWDGTAEVPANVFVWDGTAEVAANLEVV